MLAELFFVLGLLNNLLLILLFLARKAGSRTAMRRVGTMYLLLAVPAIVALGLVAHEQAAWQYALFLGVFLAFLALAWLLDFVLKIPFRKDRRLATPYLILYYAMNYGFVVMVWKQWLAGGILMLALFVVQIAVNLTSHGWGRKARAAADAPKAE